MFYGLMVALITLDMAAFYVCLNQQTANRAIAKRRAHHIKEITK